MKQPTIIISFLMTLLINNLSAQKVIPLYDGAAPGSETWNWDEAESVKNMFNTHLVYNVVKPTITVYLPKPELATGTAIIVAPGGAFHLLDIEIGRAHV